MKAIRFVPETIPWSFHPRVFTSLGAELVTNDLVALVELVKNAYDAFAHRVDVRFLCDESGNRMIEIQDDGQGMDRPTIVNSWCMVGTPFKAESTSVLEGKASRRVTGEKGLGRLSAARLGNKLRMYTKAMGGACYQVDIDWKEISAATSLDECNVLLRRVQAPEQIGDQGTILQIREVVREWDFDDEDSDLPDLNSELARFVPPFKKGKGFYIFLTLPGEDQKPVRVKPPEIVSHPEYRVAGSVDEQGVARLSYVCEGPEGTRREVKTLNLNEEETSPAKCGPFSFEFRVWDFDKESLLDLGQRLNLGQKVTEIRRQISNSPFNGIALYRDGILVLPKEIVQKRKALDRGDWLGLNLRRVSRVGKRLSTNQMIAYVEISADGNPGLRDTADRERLVDSSAARQFRRYLFQIVEFLEEQREREKTEPEHKEPPLQDLFASLLSPGLPTKIEEMEERDASWDEIRQAVSDHTREVRSTAKEIQQRFYYYSRLASVGSLAMLLQHEVGNKVGVIEELIDFLQENEEALPSLKGLTRRRELAANAVRSLQRLADVFSPLASRTFGTRRRNGVIEEVAAQVAEWHVKEIERLRIDFEIRPKGRTSVAVDPGELTAIFDNLLTNSLYWLQKVSSKDRTIRIEIKPDAKTEKVEIRFHDSGPGIEDGLEEKIFWPGVTKKEDGIGMGLTVASELVAQRGGRMCLVKPGDLDGASFRFDLPLARREK